MQGNQPASEVEQVACARPRINRGERSNCRSRSLVSHACWIVKLSRFIMPVNLKVCIGTNPGDGINPYTKEGISKNTACAGDTLHIKTESRVGDC